MSRPLCMALVAAASVAVYLKALHAGFVFDDMQNVLGNRWIRDIKYIPDIFSSNLAGFSHEYSVRYYRPVVHLIFMLDYHLFGYQAWGYHLVNVMIHACVSVLVFLTVSKLRPTRPYVPFLSAMIFALHPIHTEPVIWVSGVMDLSFSLFYLLSLLLYIKSSEGGQTKKGLYVLSVVSFGVSTLCKEPALTLPAVLAAYDAAYTERLRIKRLVPYALVAAAYLVVRIAVLGGMIPGMAEKPLSGFQYLLSVFPLVLGYALKLVFPVNLNELYAFHPVLSLLEFRAIVSITFTALLLYAFYKSYRHGAAVFFGISLAAAPLMPALFIPGTGEGVFAERYLYLSVAGLVIIFSELAVACARTGAGRLTAVLIAGMLVVFSAGTVSRSADWRDSYTLWSDTMRKTPDSAVAHEYLGYALYSMGRLGEAAAEYRKSLDIDPSREVVHLNLGAAYTSMGLLDKAIAEYRAALKLRPEDVQARYDLGDADLRKGLLDEAIEEFARAITDAPDFAMAYKGMGTAYVSAGKPEKAVEILAAGLRHNPYDAEMENDLGVAYTRLGRMDLAAEHFESASRLDPSNALYRDNAMRAASSMRPGR